MSAADDKYKELILDVYENGVWDHDGEVRTKYEDGTPAYTKSVFGRQITFEEGEIPILTSKFVGTKTALKEILLFWVHQTVKKEDFEAMNVKVWDEWFLEDQTLGKSYAYQFESRPAREIVKVKKKIKNHHGEIHKISGLYSIEESDKSANKYKDTKFISKTGLEYKILRVFAWKTHYERNKSAEIQFLLSGYKNIVTLDTALSGEVDDIYRRSYCGVGYKGNIENLKNLTKSEIKNLRVKWNHMIQRCYSEECKAYSNYGEKGIFVDPKWHSFENYLKDVASLPQFFLAKEDGFKNWEIDKDHYGSNCYSIDTCVWLKKEDNSKYSGRPVYAIDKKGKKKLFLCLRDCAEYIGITRERSNVIINCIKGKQNKTNTIKGYSFEYVDIKNLDFVYRYKLSENQVVNLINSIKNNPMSRRLMTSFWNDTDVSEKALQECAMQTTWNVKNGKLDLLLYSRSVDTALGLPFNWIQYWFLQQMVAQATGLKAGKFTHQMGSVHYYDRHEDALIKQVTKNETYDQPNFWINPEVDDFFNFTQDDIKLINYNYSNKVKYEVAI